MAAVTRLVTIVDLHDRASVTDSADDPSSGGLVPGWAPAGPEGPPADPREMSLSAVHLAVLADGRRLTLLDDRGWTESGPSGPWQDSSVETITDQARTVVGPDEPFDGYSAQDMATDHWEHLARVLGEQGVHITARDLGNLPHDVELTARLRARLSAG